jgi:transcriptional regulator with XRE-family HTH domain
MPRKLVHYLRNERRRAALTQADIAALLGGAWKGRVSWYERGAMPPTEKALEYQAILGKPVSELLGGAYDRAAFKVRRRARDLLQKDGAVPNTALRLRRRRTLERIAA